MGNGRTLLNHRLGRWFSRCKLPRASAYGFPGQYKILNPAPVLYPRRGQKEVLNFLLNDPEYMSSNPSHKSHICYNPEAAQLNKHI